MGEIKSLDEDYVVLIFLIIPNLLIRYIIVSFENLKIIGNVIIFFQSDRLNCKGRKFRENLPSVWRNYASRFERLRRQFNSVEVVSRNKTRGRGRGYTEFGEF